MNLEKLLAMKPKAIQSSVSPEILTKWNSGLRSGSQSKAEDIEIYGVIGEDYWSGEGITAKSISSKLQERRGKDISVLINSPGGDMFEGIAICNLLKQHEGKVTVKVIGLAASAASVIAMAGDEVEIAKSAFFMIHNAWTVAAGNKNDFREVADYMEPFDKAMAGLYADRTGLKEKEIAVMMDAETFISGADAVDQGFADSLLDDAQVVSASAKNIALRADVLLDTLMAKSGIPRSERRQLKKEFASTQNAASEGTLNAAFEPSEPLPRLEFNFSI